MKKMILLMLATVFCSNAAFAEPPDMKMEAEDAAVKNEVDEASGVDTRIVPMTMIQDPSQAIAKYPICSDSPQDKCANPSGSKGTM